MQLLYVDDQKDYLLGLLFPFCENIVSLSAAQIDTLSRMDAHFDLIVLNVHHSDALALLGECHQHYRDVPVIGVLHDGHDANALLLNGMDAFIAHPYHHEQIERLFARYNRMKMLDKELSRQSCVLQLDPVTQLQNADAMHLALSASDTGTLLLVDVDNFDLINSLYGIKTGDRVLEQVGTYLYKMVPSNFSVYRVSADEFGIVSTASNPFNELVLAEQIKAFFEMTYFNIDSIEFNIRVSIGISKGKSDKHFQSAKIAVKEAKDNGKNSIVLYDEASPYIKKQRENVYWINEVKAALLEQRLVTYYQPIFDNTQQKIVKYEALCRLNRRNGDVIEPGRFMGAALLGGLMSNITRAVIEAAFKKFSSNTYEFSINVTREDFKEGYLFSFLKHKCERHGIAPERVFIEIVENISFQASDGCVDQIKTLSDYGFKIAIDDFGVESSNYSRLLNIQANYLKIDGKFIQNVDKSRNSQIIVESIVNFAHKIGAKTIAEYVNSPSVYAKIIELGVDYSQGYYIGKPDSDLYAAGKIA